jgi:hypothetical protein
VPFLPPLLITIPILSSKTNGLDLLLLTPAAATDDKILALSLIFDIAITGTLLLFTITGSATIGAAGGFGLSIL